MKRALTFGLAVVLGMTGGVQAADKADATVNPFTGKPMEFERKQRELDLARLDTQILEEKSKQASLNGTLSASGLKAKAELRKIEKEIAGVSGEAPVAAEPRGRRRAPSPDSVAAPAIQMPLPGPRVVALIRSGADTVAVIEQSGNTQTVRAGERAFGATVSEIGADFAVLNGVRQTVDSSRATFAAADRQPGGQGAGAGLPAALLSGAGGAGGLVLPRTGAVPAVTPMPGMPTMR